MTWKDLPAGARDCLERLTAAGFAAYPVGGCVRDLLLGRAPGCLLYTSPSPRDCS